MAFWAFWMAVLSPCWDYDECCVKFWNLSIFVIAVLCFISDIVIFGLVSAAQLRIEASLCSLSPLSDLNCFEDDTINNAITSSVDFYRNIWALFYFVLAIVLISLLTCIIFILLLVRNRRMKKCYLILYNQFSCY